MTQDYEILEIVDVVCDELKIQKPKFKEKELNGTMLALYDRNENTIFINSLKQDSFKFDLLFTIAHELRHVWQIKYGEELYMKGYKQSHECNSIDEYNQQVAEVDANAYAVTIMEDLYHVRPRFDGLSDATKEMIYRVAETIE